MRPLRMTATTTKSSTTKNLRGLMSGCQGANCLVSGHQAPRVFKEGRAMPQQKVTYRSTILRCLDCHQIWEAILVKRPGSKFFLYAKPTDIKCPHCGHEEVGEA